MNHLEEEKKTIHELSTEELSIFFREKKESVINLKTIVIGKKDSGKSTIICNLLVFFSSLKKFIFLGNDRI